LFPGFLEVKVMVLLNSDPYEVATKELQRMARTKHLTKKDLPKAMRVRLHEAKIKELGRCWVTPIPAPSE
jgi:hypothetical protein